MITGLIFVQLQERKKERQTDRTTSKKEETGIARWSLPDQSASSKRRTPYTGMNDLPSSQQSPTSEDTPARDTGVSRIHLSSVGLEQTSATYALRHLLTKHRQRQRTPLAIIRCFLDFSSPHTPAFTPGFHHPAAATPTEWQPVPSTRRFCCPADSIIKTQSV